MSDNYTVASITASRTRKPIATADPTVASRPAPAAPPDPDASSSNPPNASSASNAGNGSLTVSFNASVGMVVTQLLGTDGDVILSMPSLKALDAYKEGLTPPSSQTSTPQDASGAAQVTNVEV
jgi:hypothetical protein